MRCVRRRNPARFPPVRRGSEASSPLAADQAALASPPSHARGKHWPPLPRITSPRDAHTHAWHPYGANGNPSCRIPLTNARALPPQDTITGFLLAGVGDVDFKKRSNFLVVKDSTALKDIENAFRDFTT